MMLLYKFFKIVLCVAAFVNISEAPPSIPTSHHILHCVQFGVNLCQGFVYVWKNSYPWYILCQAIG